MPLKKKEIAEYKKRLEELKIELTKAVRDTSAEVKSPEESKGYSQHQADEGTDDFVRSISLQVTTTEFSILRRIDRALEKIEEGTYGICDLTGEEIAKARLDAVPYATMTIEAQKRLESGQE